MYRLAALLLVVTVLCGPVRADVVINEIFYHAPDDLDNLQFIELHNTGAKAVDLAGWKLTRAVKLEFAAKTTIEANGYLVVCKNFKEFKKHYGFDAAAEFAGSLSHNKDNIELVDAAGKKVDGVKFGSRLPWPLAADGFGSSLERICPTASGKGPENWAPSPLPTGAPKPRGTPGKQNANYKSRLPPVVANVTFTPPHAAPDQEVRVEADVSGAEQSVELLYRAAGPGYENDEKSVAMTKGAKDRYSASIPAHKAGQIVRFRIKAIDAGATVRFFPNENEVRPALSVYVHDKFTPGNTPFGLVINVGQAEFRAAQKPVGGGFGFGFAGPSPSPPPRGKSAYVYVNQKTGEPEIFDFINVTPRTGGRRIRLHKDHPLGDLTTFVLIYEAMDRYALAESLSYAVYHKAGAAAPRTDFVRTWIDGRPIGFQLQIEQPNKAFLRHNGLRADGNLYKIQWYGQGVVGQHEKKTRIHEGHQDILDIVAQLNKTKGEAQWAVIKKNFDVEQVINYFAVSMLVSNWDGYFNNHFVYHDLGTGKWTMYPWDHDKTWGFHDGIRGYEVFAEMPLTFGMAGDKPPPGPNFGFGGPFWWRPGGNFSQPLLANPQFRKHFVARTRELLEKVYTEEVVFPLVKNMGERLKDDVKLRAELRREDPERALTHLDRNLDSLREHLTKRRKYLLDQPEIKTAAKFDRTELK